MTMALKKANFTSKETHAKVNQTNNVRDTTVKFAPPTPVLSQGIAIDELFGKEERRQQTNAERGKSYRTFVRYRVTDVPTDQSAIEAPSQRESLNREDGPDAEASEPTMIGEVVKVEEGVMPSKCGELCQPHVQRNLYIMLVLWASTTFCLYTINFYLKEIEGAVLVNFALAGGAEVLANVFVGFMFPILRVRWTIFMGYIIGIGGGILLLYKDSFDSNLIICLAVLLGKFGIAMAQCTLFIATPWLFPI